MLLAGSSFTSGSLADPAGASVPGAAVGWFQATLLGTLATAIAIIAIACVGLMMPTGRVNIRYGLTVIAGGFVLFGAPAIVAGIQSMAGTGYAADMRRRRRSRRPRLCRRCRRPMPIPMPAPRCRRARGTVT